MGRRAGARALPRAARLRSARDFQAVFQHGRRIERPSFVVLWRRTPDLAGRAGFAVSRQLRGAVRRNLVRRRLREAYRRVISSHPHDFAMIFVGRPSVSTRPFEELVAEVEGVLGMIVRDAQGAGARR